MKKALFFFFLTASIVSKAQTNADYLKEINRDIWLPFIEAYGSLNTEKYKSLQTDDFIRAEGNGKRLPTHKDYFNNVGMWFSDVKKENHHDDSENTQYIFAGEASKTKSECHAFIFDKMNFRPT